MKKLIITICILNLFFVCFSSIGFAANWNTVIKLKPGENFITINSDRVVVEKSFVEKGVTMVPIRAITEGFGAQVEWNSGDNSIGIINNNTTIKLFVGKSAAVVNGVRKTLDCPPEVIKNTTMVPLRFLSENFSAYVDYNSKTSQITVVIPYGDYNKRFRYISKGKIGDSFYGWSVMYPAGCTVVDKDPSGKSILVKNQDEGYYYYIYNVKADMVKNENDLLEELMSYVDNEKILSKSFIDVKGQKWADMVLESEDEIYEYRAAVKNGRMYQMHFYASRKEDFTGLTKGKEFKDILDSYDLNYVGNTQDVRDVNEIKDGLYTYRDDVYGWTINLLPGLSLDIKKSENNREIIDENGAEEGLTCGVSFSSVDSGETLSSYVDGKVSELYEDINKDYFKMLTIQETKAGAVPAKKVVCELSMGDSSYVMYDLYLISGKYKYNVYLLGRSELFTDVNSKIYDTMIQSFVPITSDKFGRIVNSASLLRGQTTEFVNDEFNWSCKYPALWDIKGEENSSTVVISDKSELLEIYVGAAKNISEQLVKQRLAEKIDILRKSDDFKMTDEQTVIEKNIPMDKLSCEYELDGIRYHYDAYIFRNGDDVFGVHFTVADVVNSEENQRRLKAFWESFQFEPQDTGGESI